MDNKQKVIIVVLVVVLVVFVVVLAVMAGSGDDGDAGSFESDRGGVFGLLGGDPATVPPGEVGGDCGRQGNTVTVQTSCDLEVGPSDQRMRLVRMRAIDEIEVTAPAPEDADFDIEKELEAGAEVAIAVDADGAEIDLDCGFGQTCRVVLLEGQS